VVLRLLTLEGAAFCLETIQGVLIFGEKNATLKGEFSAKGYVNVGLRVSFTDVKCSRE
jgi:hypothetical protein